MEHKSYTARSIIILLLAVAVVFSVWLLTKSKPATVSIIKVEKGTVEAVIANTRAGTIKACRRASIAPTTGGQIQRLLVKKGSVVKQDDILFEIWNNDLQAQLLLAKQQAKAALAIAKQRCVIADVAEREAERLKKLFKQKLTSEENADRAIGDATAQRAACDAALESHKVNEVQIDLVNVALDRTKLRAPFDAIVADINGEVGEFVTPSPIGVATLPVIDLIDASCLYVKAPIDEVDAAAIKIGMNTRISLDAYKDKKFTGQVKRIAAYVQDREKQARTVDIEVEFTDKSQSQFLLPGYSADTEIIIDIKENVLRIPTETIFDIDHVMLFNEDSDTLEMVKIEAGVSNWTYTEVLTGLRENDYVVISGKLKEFEDGMVVEATAASTNAKSP